MLKGKNNQSLDTTANKKQTSILSIQHCYQKIKTAGLIVLQIQLKLFKKISQESMMVIEAIIYFG